jgi:uncharacterized protein (TIGR03545 family)
MNRTPRWQIWVPRLLLAAVVFLAAQFGIGLAVRSLVVRTGQRLLGARVEVGNTRVSFADGNVVMNELRLDNPCCHGDGLLEADQCVLELAPQPLLHKQAVITRGRVSGLRFSALDAESTKRTADATSVPPIDWLGCESDIVATQWFVHLVERFKHSPANELESVQRTEAFCRRWAAESAELEARGKDLNARLTELQAAVDAAQANPLRADKVATDLPEAIAGLQKDFAALSADLERLPDELEAERRAIIAAKRNDETTARKKIVLEPVEANALSAYLLRAQAAKPVGELLGLLRWLREAAPANTSAKPRGEDLLFAGIQPAPGLIVRNLDLRGTARIANQAIELHGNLSGLSSQPTLMTEPLRLRVEAVGAVPLELQASIDRTHGANRDSLLLDCQGILLPQTHLGSPADLAITIEPAVGSLTINVTVDAEKLTGDIQMVQRNVRLKPALAGSFADLPIAEPLEETLARIDSLATRMTLGGTLNQPTCTLWSNIGTATAEAIERALDRAHGQRSRDALASTSQLINERLTIVERQMTDQQTRWANRVAAVRVQLDGIVITDAEPQRLSPERLGGRLPSGSLFR